MNLTTLCPAYARPYHERLRQSYSPPRSHYPISCFHWDNPSLIHSETPCHLLFNLQECSASLDVMPLGKKFKKIGDDFEIVVFCNYLSWHSYCCFLKKSIRPLAFFAQQGRLSRSEQAAPLAPVIPRTRVGQNAWYVPRHRGRAFIFLLEAAILTNVK